MPPFATVLETNGCAMPSVDSQHYSLNRPFEWVPTQNANNVENPSTGRRMGVNRDFTAYKKTKWLPFPPAVFAETRRPRSSYRFAYGRRASAAAAIGKRSYHGHWGPDHTSTGQKQPRHPPIVLSTPCEGCLRYGFLPPPRPLASGCENEACCPSQPQEDANGKLARSWSEGGSAVPPSAACLFTHCCTQRLTETSGL